MLYSNFTVLVVRVRLELTTSCVSDRCYYNQLSYLTIELPLPESNRYHMVQSHA